MKLVSKTRHGAKVYRVYDTAQTPYQRVLKSGTHQRNQQSTTGINLCSLEPCKAIKTDQR